MTELAASGARLVNHRTGISLGGSVLSAHIDQAAAGCTSLSSGPLFLRAAARLPDILVYLGALRAGRPIAVLDPEPGRLDWSELVARYRPSAVTGTGLSGSPPPPGYHTTEHPGLGPCWVPDRPAVAPPPHPDLALLLATSGSTGRPRLVRLSRHAVTANAAAIATALDIQPHHAAPTSLPLHYSYGLSVLNSHLVRGAAIVLVDEGILARSFWTAVDEHRVTTFNGVPAHYEILRRMSWTPAAHPSLEVLTQAGGRLRPAAVREFHAAAHAAGARFHTMWGQTEAGPRMTVLPADALPHKAGSVGIAVPGGRLTVRLDDGTETTDPHITGEIIYRGPGVMLGYADTAEDLAVGDTLHGTLRTGDLGNLDDDGHLWLTGRINRIGKAFGVRYHLDHIERLAAETAPAAAVAGHDRILVYREDLAVDEAAATASRLADQLGIPRGGLKVCPVDRLPLTPRGKIDYRALEEDGDVT